jgi:dihydroneopterin aldolase
MNSQTHKDKIKITGLQAWGHHGVMAEETKLGQKFISNITLELNTQPAGLSDDLAKTVHYAEVSELVIKHLTGKPVLLIETLAENIATETLNQFPILSGITVEIQKPFAPVGIPLDGIAVEIYRTR